jgi:hypothetical protein
VEHRVSQSRERRSPHPDSGALEGAPRVPQALQKETGEAARKKLLIRQEIDQLENVLAAKSCSAELRLKPSTKPQDWHRLQCTIPREAG